jgi:hypothetical protein
MHSRSHDVYWRVVAERTERAYTTCLQAPLPDVYERLLRALTIGPVAGVILACAVALLEMCRPSRWNVCMQHATECVWSTARHTTETETTPTVLTWPPQLLTRALSSPRFPQAHKMVELVARKSHR